MTEHTTIESVFSFIDDTPIKTIDVLELKSRIAEVVAKEKFKVIDEFADKMIIMMQGHRQDIEQIAEQMKGGAV